MSSTLFNNGIFSDQPFAFARDLATVDEQGIVRAADEPRFANPIGVAPLLDWTELVTLSANSTSQFYDVGLDSDGETILSVFRDAAVPALKIYTGTTFASPYRTINITGTNPNFDISGGEVTDTTYEPVGAVVCHGYIFILCNRRVSGDSIGITVYYLADKDADLARVPVVEEDSEGDNGLDFEALPGGVLPTSPVTGRAFSIKSHLIDLDNQAAGYWVTICDYTLTSNDSRGGQCGAFRLSGAGGTFTLEKIRKIFEDWDADATNNHIHGLVPDITNECFYVVRGDDYPVNEIIRCDVAFSDYENATITTTTVHGGYDSGDPRTITIPTVHTYAMRQGRTGDVFHGPGDLTRAKAIKFTTDSATSVIMREQYGGRSRNRTETQGFAFNSWPGAGYVWGGINNASFGSEAYFSADGEHWAAISVPFTFHGNGNTIKFLGPNFLVVYDHTSGKIYSCPRPVVDVVRPLQIAPGGTNLVDNALAQSVAPGTGNTVTAITWDGSQYLAGATPITPQPPPPPFKSTTPIIRCVNGSSSTDFGRRFLTDGTVPWSGVLQVATMWVCNLNKDRMTYPSSRVARGGAGQMAAHDDEIAGYLQWTPSVVSGTPTAGADARAELFLVHPADLLLGEGSDFLLAMDSFVQAQGAPPYSMGLDTTGPDELGEITIATGAAWTNVLQAAFSNLAPTGGVATLGAGNQTYYIGTAWQDANNYVELSIVQTSTTAGNIVADFVVAGSSVGTLSVAVDVQPNDVVSIGVSSTGTAQVLSARNHRIAQVSDSDTLTADIQPVAFYWGNAAQDDIPNFHPIMLRTIPDAAWDATEIGAWMEEGLNYATLPGTTNQLNLGLALGV